jgi:hypothetical protein
MVFLGCASLSFESRPVHYLKHRTEPIGSSPGGMFDAAVSPAEFASGQPAGRASCALIWQTTAKSIMLKLPEHN